MPHAPTEFRARGEHYTVGPHVIRQLSSDHDGDGIHDLQWSTHGNLGDVHVIAACPFGGPIARADRHDFAAGALPADHRAIDNLIYLFSSTGEPLIDPNAAYNKQHKGRLIDADGTPNYEPIVITDIGRRPGAETDADPSPLPAMIAYMCWDDTDTLLVCLTNGMVWAFTATGAPAVDAPIVVEGATIFNTYEYGVAIVTRQKTAAFVHRNGRTLCVTEVDIGVADGYEISSFAAIPRNRFPAKIVDRVVGGAKVPMRMESTTHELLIAAIDPNEAYTACSDIFLATYNSESGKASCFQLDIDVSRFPEGRVLAFAVAPHKARIAMIMACDPDPDAPARKFNVYACSSDFRYIHGVGHTMADCVPAHFFWISDEIVAYALLSTQFKYDETADAAEFTTAIIAMPYPGDQHSFNPPPNDGGLGDSIVEVEIANMPADAYVVPESTNSIRVLSSDTFQIFQVVPQEIQSIFATDASASSGSSASSPFSSPSSSNATVASMLALAFDEYAAEGPNCVELINAIMRKAGELDHAIDQLVTAAGFEFDVDAQKRFLRVANFAKSFSSTYVTDNFVNMCRRLRILQCLRSIGTLLSIDQLAAMEEKRLTQRLASHQHFQMAFEFADVLDLSVEPILTIWAKHLLASIPKASEATAHERQTYLNIVTDMILNKFELHQARGELPYVTIANYAYSLGRAAGDEALLTCAWNLVKAAPSARGRFDALLLWHDYERAAAVAVESGDPAMVFTVLLEATDGQSESELDGRIIPQLNRFPETAALLRTYVRMLDNAPRLDEYSSAAQLLRQYKALFRETDTARVMAEYFSEVASLRREAASIGAGGGSNSNNNSSRNAGGSGGGGISTSQQLTLDRLHRSVRDAAVSVEMAVRGERGGAANVKAIQLQQFLLDRQHDLLKFTGDRGFINASVIQTIRLCYKHRRYSDATELAQQFTVSEKMLAWAKLRAFVAAHNWEEVDKLAGAKRGGPISPDALVAVLMEAGELEQAAKHIPKLNPIERRMELYVACGDWRGACDDCLRSREEDMLSQLRARAKTESALAIIDAALRKAGR